MLMNSFPEKLQQQQLQQVRLSKVYDWLMLMNSFPEKLQQQLQQLRRVSLAFSLYFRLIKP